MVHGGQHSACDLVEDTGTRIEVTKLGQNKFRIDLRLRGGDSESQM